MTVLEEAEYYEEARRSLYEYGVDEVSLSEI